MKTFQKLAVLGICSVLSVLAPSVHANETDWNKVNQKMGVVGSRTNILKNASYQVPQQYGQIRAAMIQESGRLMVFVNTVSQNLAVIKQNPENTQSLQWAIQYAREASDSAEELEKLGRQLKREARQTDDDQTKQFAKRISKFADEVDDAITKVRREID